MAWKIKTAEVWLSSVDLRWVYEGEHDIIRELSATVSDNRMTLEAFILFEGETLVHKQYVLADRSNVNIYITYDHEIESAFALVMSKGVRQF